MIFTKKYEPKTFDDIIGNGDKIKEIVESGDFKHLILFGSAGKGKTTSVKVIVEQLGLNYIKLNASDERSIEVLRGKLKDFAMSASTNGKKKVIWLDEAEAISREGIDALRGFIDDYEKSNIFIMTTNYLYKIPEPIQSRCIKISYDIIDNKLIFNKLKEICQNENVDIDDNTLLELIKSCKNDIRSCINKLEELSKLKRKIVIGDLKNDFDLVESIHLLLQQRKFIDARQLYLDSNMSAEDFINDYHSYIMDLTITKGELSPDYTKRLIERFFECISIIKFSANQDICVDWLLLKIMEK